jgi:hypothetical protein
VISCSDSDPPQRRHARASLCRKRIRTDCDARKRAGTGIAHVLARRLRMLMFKRSQLYIALALTALAEILVRAAMR